MALFRGIQKYIALDANNIALVFNSGNIVGISGNELLYPPKKSYPILYNYLHSYKPTSTKIRIYIVKSYKSRMSIIQLPYD